MSSGTRDEIIRDWLAEYAFETMRTQTLDQVVERLDAVIVDRVPELRDHDIRRDLTASTRAHARLMLGGLTSDSFDVPLPEEVHALARTIAQRGYDLRLLLRTYHVGLEAVLDYLRESFEERQAPPEIERTVLVRTFERATRWVNTSVELLTETYLAEREQVLRAVLNRRAETVRALLAGDDVDPEQAAVRLGYRLNQQHLAFVLWSDEPFGGEGDVIGGLDRVAHRIAAALGSNRLLTVASGASGMWAWAGLDDAQAARLAGPEEPLLLAAAELEPPVRVAFGVPAPAAAGFRRGHREAVSARQVAERSGAPVTGYRAVEIAYLAGVDRAAMRGLVRRELRALAGRDAATIRLRETLHAYLRHQRSPEATARQLGVHKNTVRYRIQRVEELLGHPVEERGLALEVALTCVAAYGPGALD
ncbi:helix-turn-helix domain-containing protein [Nocardia sp. NPDC050697]|uniref:PucR family transcriptional regulator n=1 Tax=Nocardia sp. NPDC050697 TaxID=3155158 RepID=UPI0033E30A7B